MPLRSRDACVAVFVTAAAVSIGAAAQTDRAAEPPSTVTVIGCVQRQEKAEVRGLKSPSGLVLVNASNSPFGGTLPDDPERPAATAGSAQPRANSDEKPRSGEPVPAPGGGASIGPGPTYLLEGKNLDAHAGERVEVRGTLHGTAAKLPLTKRSERGGDPTALPERLVVQSIRTLARDCSR